MKYRQNLIGALLAGFALVAADPVRGDTIQLSNGDVINGKVISLDAKQLVLQSELLGELKLDRAKVSSIHLGDKPVTLTPAVAPAVQAQHGKTQPAVDPAVQQVLDAVPSTDDVIKELQGGGANQQMIGALKTKFPLLNTPEASGYFNDTLGGLMTGRLNIGDVRKDAVKARDELKKLQDELGPDGAALNGYMSILNKFIRETEPPETAKQPAANNNPAEKSTAEKRKPATFPPRP